MVDFGWQCRYCKLVIRLHGADNSWHGLAKVCRSFAQETSRRGHRRRNARAWIGIRFFFTCTLRVHGQDEQLFRRHVLILGHGAFAVESTRTAAEAAP